VVDLTLNQKKWYVIAGIASALGIAAMGFFPATKLGLTALSIVGFLASLATTFLGMAVESLMTYSTPDELKGRAGGWFQAGNLGGNGIGGGLGLFLASHLQFPWMASCAVGALCLLCCAALINIPTPVRDLAAHGIRQGVSDIFKDLWSMMRQRLGLLALILCFLPVGSGAAPLSAIASEWSASANTVALVTGILGGVISAAGCLVGGWWCDRLNRQVAYVWFGIFQAAGAVTMALLPHNEPMYIVWASVYTFTTGLTYAAFTAFVLEAVGIGAAATKYNALASLSNMPIYYMTVIDGWAHDRWNASGMFFMEAALGVIGAVVFVVLTKIILPSRKTVPT
jgi:MFS family permease